ncbi:hypothetical protein JXR93_03915 [bacterium]|nr:hypothetical protein [bacterium]
MLKKTVIISIMLFSITLLSFPKDKIKNTLNYLEKCSNGDLLGYYADMREYLQTWHGYKFDSCYSKQHSRREKIDFFSLLTGGVAIRESLQTDSISAVFNEEYKSDISELNEIDITPIKFDELVSQKERIKHSNLAFLTPKDFYYIYTSGLKNALDFWDSGFKKIEPYYKKYSENLVDYQIKEKIVKQLALKENKEARVFYDSVIDEIAIIGNDPFIINGSDVTLLIKAKNSFLLKSTIAIYRESFKKDFSIKDDKIKISGKEFSFLESQNREIYSVFGEIDKDIFIISNSKKSVEKILYAMKNKKESLGTQAEFRYVRKVFPFDSNSSNPELNSKSILKKEDKKSLTNSQQIEDSIFIYLSDPFIRKLVNPKLRISEARRLREFSKISIIQRFITLFKEIQGKEPKSVNELITVLTPEKNGKEHVKYYEKLFSSLTIEKDGTVLSKIVGKPGFMTPNIEMEVTKISADEKSEYTIFAQNYHNLWREYFDPIGIKITSKDGNIRVETHILPLINSSIYQMFSSSFPTTSNISIDNYPNEISAAGVHFSHQIKVALDYVTTNLLDDYNSSKANPFSNFFSTYGGDKISFHIMDAHPMIDFDSSAFITELGLSFRGRNEFFIIMLSWILFHPVRASFDLKDSFDEVKAEEGFFDSFSKISNFNDGRDFSLDGYTVLIDGKKVAVLKLNIFQIFTFRFYIFFKGKTFNITTTEEYARYILSAEPSISKDNGSLVVKVFPNQIKKERLVYEKNMLEKLIVAVRKNINTTKIEQYPKDSSKFFSKYGFILENIDKSFESDIDYKMVERYFEPFFNQKELGFSLSFTKDGLHAILDIKAE